MTMSNPPLSPTLPDHDLFEFGVRAALGPAFAFYAGVCFNRAFAEFATVDFSRLASHLFSQALATLAIGLYALTVACLYALRLRPIRRASGAWPSAAALLGGFLMFGLLMLDQRTDLPLATQAAASILILAGNGFAIYVLAHLGRSFSILPESRRLVTSGLIKSCAIRSISQKRWRRSAFSSSFFRLGHCSCSPCKSQCRLFAYIMRKMSCAKRFPNTTFIPNIPGA